MLIKWAPHYTSFLLLCDPDLTSWGTGRHLTCENISAADRFSVGKKDRRTRDTESSNTGNWVTTSRKEGACGCRKHLGAILAYLFSKQQRANLSSGTRGPGWTGPRGNSFIHFQKFKFRSLVPMWATYHMLKWPKNGLSRERISFICAKTAWATVELVQCSIFTHAMYEMSQMRPRPPVFKSNCILWSGVTCSSVL